MMTYAEEEQERRETYLSHGLDDLIMKNSTVSACFDVHRSSIRETTREEMLIMMVRMLHKENKAIGADFLDYKRNNMQPIYYCGNGCEVP